MRRRLAILTVGGLLSVGVALLLVFGRRSELPDGAKVVHERDVDGQHLVDFECGRSELRAWMSERGPWLFDRPATTVGEVERCGGLAVHRADGCTEVLVKGRIHDRNDRDRDWQRAFYGRACGAAGDQLVAFRRAEERRCLAETEELPEAER